MLRGMALRITTNTIATKLMGPTSTLAFLRRRRRISFRFDAVATRGFSFDDERSESSSGLALTCVVLARSLNLVPVVGLGP